MTAPFYSLLLAGFLVLLQAGLMLSVGMHRLRGQFVGIGDDLDLERKVRRHGNLAENSGLFLAALATLEIVSGSTDLLLGLCLLFAIARVMHAIGFSSMAGSHGHELHGPRKLFAGARMIGAFGTIFAAMGLAYAALAVWLSSGA